MAIRRAKDLCLPGPEQQHPKRRHHPTDGKLRVDAVIGVAPLDQRGQLLLPCVEVLTGLQGLSPV